MSKGFGPAPVQPKVSKRSQERQSAGQRFDSMKAGGSPEYEIYMRIKDKPNWVPVGAIAVQRSNAINQALYANEEQLLQAAFRLSPLLKKFKDNLEYGYRLKEYKDEEVTLAVRPEPPKISAIGKAIAQVGEKVGGLFKRS